MIIRSNERPLLPLPSQFVNSLEAAILGVLWACPQPLTVRAIHAALHNHALSYSTIITVLARMTEQGSVSQAPTAARYAAAYRSTSSIGPLRTTVAV